MTDDPAQAPVRFEAPGEGDWWLVREHFPYPVSRLFATLFPPATLGWTSGARRYGLPRGEARWGDVGGWIYYGPQSPPTDDDLAARAEVAAGALVASPWRDEPRRWWDEERPSVVAANRSLQAVDPAVLDDESLAAHVDDAIANFRRWAPLHFEHAAFDLAGGLLFEAAAAWGLDPSEVAALMAGASPGSAAADAHLAAVAAALDRAGAPDAATLDAVRAAGPEPAAALDAYLDDYGWRPIAGHDVVEPTVGERPATVAAVIAARRRAAERGGAGGAGGADDGRGPADGLRARVPAPERDRFDVLVADARAAYALRDDDVGVCWNWPLGLIRRSVLEGGRRLAARGRLHRADHLVAAEVDAVVPLLRGGGPDADELAGRALWRARMAAADPPVHLAGGGPPEPEPVVPAAVARLDAVTAAAWRAAPRPVDAPLHGVGVGAAPAVGPARLVLSPEDVFDLSEGDVLVAVATTTAFNAVFPLVAAVVTEQGGLFSHAAILCRELGVPAVVGVADVLDRVRTGDVVEVDPAAGRVRVAGRHP